MVAKCPVCNWIGYSFLPKNGRNSVLCPRCGSYERHRHQFIVYKSLKLDACIDEFSVLHLAPEQCIVNLLKRAKYYVSLDLQYKRAKLTADLTKLPFKNNTFQLIWVSHVLEHIRDIKQALLEIHRVLSKLGIAILDVPIYNKRTKMLKKPGRFGHVWKPGLDWFHFYKNTGFSISLYNSNALPKEYYVNKLSYVCIGKKK